MPDVAGGQRGDGPHEQHSANPVAASFESTVSISVPARSGKYRTISFVAPMTDRIWDPASTIGSRIASGRTALRAVAATPAAKRLISVR
ncbi:hypothetical protein SHIRM173S_03984 [Streptomyces hirsutus]